MKNMRNIVQGFTPVLLMMMVQITYAGVNIFYKLAANEGMSLRIIIAYRFLFAAAFIVPLAHILERKKRTYLKMTWTVLFQSFLCGLFGGTLSENLYLQALSLTSATSATAMTNLVPCITFILAVSFRLERLNLGTTAGKAKIIGTLIGISGAMLLTFLKGKEIHFWSFHLNLLHHQNVAHPIAASTHIFGALAALASAISYALWLIIQAKMGEKYPYVYSSTGLMSLWAAIQSSVAALLFERNFNQWKLGWNLMLWTAGYSGVVVSGTMVVVISWCIKMRGPLFVSAFSPLLLVVVTLASTTMLNEKLHLGSIIGAVMIATGLYGVIWGKSKEMKKSRQLKAETPNDSDTAGIVTSSNVENDAQIVGGIINDHGSLVHNSEGEKEIQNVL